jgi:hypothetical protein
MLRTGISVAWMVDMNSYADSIRRRTWKSIASQPDWADWLAEHVDFDKMESYVYIEGRDKQRLVVRGNTLSAYVPAADVQAAYEMKTLPAFMADLYRSVFAKWAEKRKLPAPPGVEAATAAGPSRFDI